MHASASCSPQSLPLLKGCRICPSTPRAEGSSKEIHQFAEPQERPVSVRNTRRHRAVITTRVRSERNLRAVALARCGAGRRHANTSSLARPGDNVCRERRLKCTQQPKGQLCGPSVSPHINLTPPHWAAQPDCCGQPSSQAIAREIQPERPGSICPETVRWRQRR
ncbi:unnamed protein product [Lota lota]